MRNAVAGGSGSSIQSVDRAMEVLELLSRKGWSGATDVARALAIHKSTAFRLLATLERHGVVEQDGRTAKYRLGARLPQLASTVTADLDIRRHARPSCERLAEQAGETVTLDLPGSLEVLHVDQIVQSASVVGVNWLGRRTPLHCTASGKVFLAFATPEMATRVLDGHLEARTAFTIVDPNSLRAQFASIRSVGYAHTTEELELGLNAIAAPVRFADGSVKACVNLSGPSQRLPPERLLELSGLTKACADEVSRRLGFRAAPIELSE